MKIAIITNNYPSVLDGVGAHSFYLANEFRKNGHEVFIICSANKEIITAAHPNVYPVVEQWDKNGYNKALQQLSLLKPDWVLLQYVPYGFQRIGLPWRMPFFVRQIHRKGFPLLISFHEIFVRLTWHLRKIYPVGILQRLIAAGMCLYADRIVTSIEFYRKSLSWFTRKKIEVIPVAPNFDTAVSCSAEQVSKVKMHIPKDRKIVATYGIRDKQYMLHVFEAVLAKDSNIQFLHCGSVKDQEMIDRLGDHLYVTGYLSASEVPVYLKTADVFFLPDPVDRKGNGGTSNRSGSLAAALYVGIPVIAIRGDMNNPELINDSQVVLADYYDIDTLSDTIISVAQRGTAATGKWEKKLNWKTIANQYFE